MNTVCDVVSLLAIIGWAAMWICFFGAGVFEDTDPPSESRSEWMKRKAAMWDGLDDWRSVSVGDFFAHISLILVGLTMVMTAVFIVARGVFAGQ